MLTWRGVARALATLAAASGLAAGAVPAVAADVSSAAAAAAASAPAALTHRPLRSNQPVVMPAPTEPEVFVGYPDARPFTVVPRRGQLALYPCSQCHKVLPLNTTPRKLVGAPHPAALDHGKGRLWCLDCHQGNDRDVLHTIGGAKVDFDQSPTVCGQCHSARHRDWTFGAHGKRVAGWQDKDRQLYSCTHCHDPHKPALQPRAPSPPPPVRAGLSPMKPAHGSHPLPWQRAPQGPHDGPAR